MTDGFEVFDDGKEETIVKMEFSFVTIHVAVDSIVRKVVGVDFPREFKAPVVRIVYAGPGELKLCRKCVSMVLS